MKRNTTITPILYSRKDKDNLYPVKIRITEERKSQFISLGFSISKSHWLKSTRRVSTSNPNHREFNYTIEQKIKEYDNVNKKYGVIKIGRLNVFCDLDDKIKSMIGQQYYTSKRYKTLYLHLESFCGNLGLNYHQIDRDFFRDFKNYLQNNITPRDNLSNTPSSNTIVNYLNTLKTFLLEKQREGVYLSDLHFTKGIIPKKNKTPKRTLEVEEIWKLENILPSHPKFRPLLWNSLNTFMFNFWSQGLRIGDCLRLKWGNIQDDVISLKMEKTDIGLTIPLNDSNIHRLKWFISEKDLFPIWNWERKEWNNYFPIPNEEKNEIEKITTPFPLDILSSIENSYQYDWLNMIEELKDKEFEYYYIDQMSDFRPKDRYGYEYHSYFKSKNPHLFETLNERLMIFNKELKLVINKISKDENYRNQFIFPFLRGYENERDLTKFSNKISSSVSLINKSLKEISKIVGIEKKISNHWSRHTITSISKSLGVDLYELKNWLGHTSVKTTESYVNTITTHSSIKNTKNVKNLLENPNSI
jgi:integrase